MDNNWVYRAEYSLSDRSSCKRCGNGIGKNIVRLCIMVQSPFHDGKDAQWHHPQCFFRKKPNVSVDEIWHFHDLRWKDQERIRRLAAGKSGADDDDDDDEGSDDSVQEIKPTKNGKAKRGQNHGSAAKKKQKLNISGVDSSLKLQTDMLWECRDLISKVAGKDLKAILEENQQHIPVASKIPERVADMLLFGATEKCGQCSSDRGHIVISADAYYCIGHVSEWAKCDYKPQEPSRKAPVISEKLVGKYDFLEKYLPFQPRTRIFPGCFAMTNGIGTASAGSSVSVVDGPSTSGASSSVNGSGKKILPPPKVKKLNPKKPLKGFKLGAAGKLARTRSDMQAVIKELGGSVVSKASLDTLVIISDAVTIASRPVILEMAEVCRVHVVPLEFLDECASGKLHTEEELSALIQKIKINTWKASSPLERMRAKESASEPLPSGLSSTELHRLQEEKKTALMYAMDDDKMKVIVKNGGAVDTQSGLDEETHSVLKEDGMIYACVLAKADIQAGMNSFYKMQIIKRDNKPVYYFFRAWGRIGTTIGGDTMVETDKQNAIDQFEFHFMDKTGNQWADCNAFVKRPGKYFVMDLDFGEEETVEEYAVAPGSKTKLAKPVQELIKMIFDVEEMKKTLRAFEIDLKKMPLGKLSRRQITEAMKVLNELQLLIEAGERPNSPRFIDGSNRFFTFIPHVFSVGGAPLLNRAEDVKAKLDMLDNLLQIEVAFSILRSGDRDSDKDPLDQHYGKLNCDMEAVDKKSWDFEMVKRYMSNTHAATHSNYKLQLLEVFKVRRSGELERFADFKALDNHKLLWHGSRVTNFAGILSQGLRIAPPEAPVTGYMFGKGVYFADMVSKSANYCFTSEENNVGLLLLSDVALGKMKLLYNAECITRLSPEVQSVKGCGQTYPDPEKSELMENTIEIPCGLPKSAAINSSLLYNEYIVYKEAQVNLRYLVKVKFNYGR